MFNIQQDIQEKKREVKGNPDQYPEIPGEKYWIMVCDSEGNLTPGGREVVGPPNPTLKVMSFPEKYNPGEKYLCFVVN